MAVSDISDIDKHARLRRILVWGLSSVVLSLVVLIGALVCFLPGIIESRAQAFVTENFGCKLTIRKIDLDWFGMALRLDGVRLSNQNQETDLVSFDHLSVALASETLTSLNPVIREVRLVNPTIHIIRDKNGRSNIQDMVDYFSKPDETPSKKKLFSINNIQVENGTIRVEDALRKKQLLIEELDIGIPFIANMPTDVEVFVKFGVSAKVNKDKIEFVGKSKAEYGKKSGTLGIKLDKLDLPTYFEYLPFDLGVKLKSGKFSADLDIIFSERDGDKRPVYAKGSFVLQSVMLVERDNRNVMKIPELRVDIGKSDITTGKIGIERIVFQNPQVFLDRNNEGQWNIERFSGAEKHVSEKTASAGNSKVSSGKSWIFDIDHLMVNGGQLQLIDRFFPKPIHVMVNNFGLEVGKLSLDMAGHNVSADHIISTGTRVRVVHSMSELLEQYLKEDRSMMAQKVVNETTKVTGFSVQVKHAGIRDWAWHFENTNAKQPIITRVTQLEIMANNLSDAMDKPVSFSMHAKVNDRGKSSVKGNITVSPLNVDLDIDMRHIDMRFIQPYINDYVNLLLRQADLSLKGKLSVRHDGALQGQFHGGAAISNLSAVDQMTGRPVISWKDLAFEDLAVNLKPLSVAINKAKMSDVVARVILSADGRLNLQDILRSKAGGKKSLAESGNDRSVVSDRHRQPVLPQANPAGYMGDEKRDFALSIDKWFIRGGRVRFSDNFIKPRYTADIVDLRGAFLNLSNDPKTQSQLWLKGLVNGAPLVVSGYINPLSETLKLNINAEIKGMELAQFSAYSGKYLGYGIRKGKLSYKATYKIENGQLNAENALLLDQLTLGEKVEGSEATDLPVELALSLLKDSNGVIDISIPIAGSLSDPEFSLGSVIGTVISNALKKVVTAPFSFLSSLSENEKSLSGMVFAAGSSGLTPENEQRLERIAKGLAKHPHVKLEITGLYDDVADREGLGHFVLERKIRALKRKKLDLPSFEEIVVSETEYPELLKEVYRNEKFDKPKQLMFFEKTLSVREMEEQLVRHYASVNDSLILLANRRAETVKNWLVLKGGLDDGRIYLLASKQGKAEKDLPAHRVDLDLRWKS